MNIQLLTKEDLLTLKNDIITEMKNYFQLAEKDIIWLRGTDVKRILGCSEGTLVNLRASRKLKYYKISGTIYYKKQEVHVENPVKVTTSIRSKLTTLIRSKLTT